MMSLARRSLAVVASAATLTIFMTGGFPLGAQEGGSAKSQTTKSKQVNAPAPADSNATKDTPGKPAPPDLTQRVPPGYSKLGLTDQQKEKLYKIQAEYYPKIQALEKQVTSLREKREKEFESVLTAAQKRLLAEAEHQKKAAAEAKKAAAAKAAAKEKAGS